MSRRVSAGMALLLVLLSSTAVLVVGVFLILRPEWLGLRLPATDSLASDPHALPETLDSLPLPSPWEDLHEQLRYSAAREAALLDSLNRLRHHTDSLRTELQRLRSELLLWQQRWSQQSDTLRWQHYEAFAKIYNNAPPEEVARILEQLPPQEAARILKAMNRRQAARVITALPPEYAAAALNSPAPPPSP